MKFNSCLDNIANYEAGKPIDLVVREYGIQSDQVIKLASNENPYGCSPRVQTAVAAILNNMSVYPDDSMYQLKRALSEKFSVKESELIIGAGSDQVIEFAVRAKTGAGGKILTNSITFAMYEIYAAQVAAEVIKTDSQTHDLNQFYDLYRQHRPDIIFICTPNNPTGDALDAASVFEFLDKIDSDTLVVIDCAYMEYAALKDPTKLITPSQLAKYENTLYLGTFSKAYGLGGMRIGYGIAHSQIIAALYKMRPPFNVSTLALQAAQTALEDQTFVELSVQRCLEQMKRYESFAIQRGIHYINSYTNFITYLLREPYNSRDMFKTLMSQGVIVRDLTSYRLNSLRITIGAEWQNNRFFELFEKLLQR